MDTFLLSDNSLVSTHHDPQEFPLLGPGQEVFSNLNHHIFNIAHHILLVVR